MPMMCAELSPRATILVVEDEPLLRDSASRLLESLGYRVLAAADGPNALEILSKGEKIDVLFSDVVLPGGMTGEMLANQVKERHPKVKILLTSAYSREVLIAQGRLVGKLPLLNKPFRRDQLSKSVQDLLIEARTRL